MTAQRILFFIEGQKLANTSNGLLMSYRNLLSLEDGSEPMQQSLSGGKKDNRLSDYFRAFPKFVNIQSEKGMSTPIF